MASSGYEDMTHQEAAFVQSMLDSNPKGDKIIDDVIRNTIYIYNYPTCMM